MVFSSMVFLTVFLPAVLIISSLLPSTRLKNLFLMAASLLFYAYGESIHVLLMILCAFWNYLVALLIGKSEAAGMRKFLLFAGMAADLAMLGVYKYAGMVVETFNNISGSALPVPQIALPIGISFFTFQAMGYVADVYRKTVKSEKRFTKVLLYISFFPQLIAGPIVRYRDIAQEIDDRRVSPADLARGLRRFTFGLAKKVLISNAAGAMADYVFALSAGSLSLPTAWLGALAYMLQIYYDFSGYSDMAIGLGRMFGFHFLENFNYPYSAVSMLDFWRRWHISLTNWFRENLYFPLGGNRKGKLRTWINRIIVFFFTGLWHGANWTFVLWGLYHGAFTILEVAFPNLTKKMGKLSHLYVLVVVCIGFVLFRSDTIAQAQVMISSMFIPVAMDTERTAILMSQLHPLNLAVLLGGFILAMPVGRKLRDAAVRKNTTGLFLRCASYAGTFILLLLSMFSLSGGAYNPFIYFRF